MTICSGVQMKITYNCLDAMVNYAKYKFLVLIWWINLVKSNFFWTNRILWTEHAHISSTKHDLHMWCTSANDVDAHTHTSVCVYPIYVHTFEHYFIFNRLLLVLRLIFWTNIYCKRNKFTSHSFTVSHTCTHTHEISTQIHSHIRDSTYIIGFWIVSF